MQGWQSTYLGAREVPRELSSFELQTFFTYSRAEHELIGRRRGSMMKLGLALHIGFLRMTGCPLNAFGILPLVLLRHLAIELDIDTPDLASLRALYARGRTLSDHQLLACQTLGFRWMVAHQRPALVRALRDEVSRCGDRERLLSYARQWLYQHRLIIFHERALRSLVASELAEFEARAAASIHSTVPPATWRRWVAAMEQVRPDGQHIQNWLWAAPAKHSTRQFAQVLERIEWLVEIGVDRHPIGLNDVLVRRFAHRLAARSPSFSARIKEPARTLEVGSFLRYCLLTATDQLILMFQRRVADLWRQSADDVTAPVDWAAQYRQLRHIGDIQLPEVILAVDAQARFSWHMLGREPRSEHELLTVYAGILAHGTSLTAAECARMIPQLSATSIRQAMRWAGDERRLAQACKAVLEFMHRHPIAASWGRSDLASSDMMSLETSQRVWQARQDPRRQTASVGIYTHVRDRWGIFHAQPIVLNERQAGAAIEGVIRQERIETTQLAVDTHGYTDFAMALARLLGFDLCPRLRELKQRRLFVPRGTAIPDEIAAVCVANVDTAAIEAHWDSLVHLAASVMSGHASAVAVLGRFGSAARGDPLYEAGVQLGKLLRTAFLADYFVNACFRRELLRVLNRGEAVNSLKRAIYTGRISAAQAKRTDELQAVADALSLLANILMAWNTAQMQSMLDQEMSRRQPMPAELFGRIAPTRLEGINLRGVYRFPIEHYTGQLLPSQTAPKTRAAS